MEDEEEEEEEEKPQKPAKGKKGKKQPPNKGEYWVSQKERNAQFLLL